MKPRIDPGDIDLVIMLNLGALIALGLAIWSRVGS